MMKPAGEGQAGCSDNENVIRFRVNLAEGFQDAMNVRWKASSKLSLVISLACFLSLPCTAFPQKHPRPREAELLEIGPSKIEVPKRAPAEIKIVSYNIRWRGADELRELIRFLKDDAEVGGATIIGLQEVDRNKKRTQNVNTIKLIAAELGKYYAWAAPPGPKADREEETGVAILSSYPISDVRRLILPHEGPGGRRRVALGATITIPGASIRVYSVHAETRISIQNKMNQLRAVLDDLAQHPRDMSVVILGDFNTWEPDAVEKTSALFASANFDTPFKNDQETFWRRVLSILITLKLDWIWLRDLEVTGHGIDEKICLSDHWPLWTMVRVPEKHLDHPSAR